MNKWCPERERERYTCLREKDARLERGRYTCFRVEGSGQVAPLARERKMQTLVNVPVIVLNRFQALSEKPRYIHRSKPRRCSLIPQILPPPPPPRGRGRAARGGMSRTDLAPPAGARRRARCSPDPFGAHTGGAPRATARGIRRSQLSARVCRTTIFPDFEYCEKLSFRIILFTVAICCYNPVTRAAVIRLCFCF